jgi:hypothetical protein
LIVGLGLEFSPFIKWQQYSTVQPFREHGVLRAFLLADLAILTVHAAIRGYNRGAFRIAPEKLQ